MNSNPAPKKLPGSEKNFFQRTKKMTSRQCWFALSVVIVVLSTISIVLSQALDVLSVNKVKLIIDTDAGTDDAMALFYLLRTEKHVKHQNNSDTIDILGITCVTGNTFVSNVVVNVLKVLHFVNRMDIPVYLGTDRALVKSPGPTFYFGRDGLGDVPTSNPPSPDSAQTEHAVNALIRLVDENPGEITLLALGPLTNIAMAVRIDNRFIKKLKKLVIMGGCVEGKGNTLPGVEFNFYADPEAAYVVLNGSDYNENSIVLFPWETVLTADISMEWRKEVLGKLESDEIAFMNKIEHIENYPDDGIWTFADPLVAIVAMNESFIEKKERYSVEAILEGPTRGGLSVDYTNLISGKKIDIIYKINIDLVKNALIKHFT